MKPSLHLIVMLLISPYSVLGQDQLFTSSNLLAPVIFPIACIQTNHGYCDLHHRFVAYGDSPTGQAMEICDRHRIEEFGPVDHSIWAFPAAWKSCYQVRRKWERWHDYHVDASELADLKFVKKVAGGK